MMREFNQHGFCVRCKRRRYRRVTSATFDREPFTCGACAKELAEELKPRTREAIADRFGGGDSLADLMRDYALPAEAVERVIRAGGSHA